MPLFYKIGFLFLFAVSVLVYISQVFYSTGKKLEMADRQSAQSPGTIPRGGQLQTGSQLSDIAKSSRTAFITSLTAGGIFLVLACILFIHLMHDTRRNQTARAEMMNREARYRELIEDAGVVMFTTDNHGIFTFVTNKTASLTGYTVEEVVGNHFSFLVVPDQIAAVTAHYIKQYHSEAPELYVEFAIHTKDNVEKWVEQHSVLIRKEGKITGFQCIVKDITDRKRVETQLLAVENQRAKYEYRVQAILDYAPLMIYIKDLEGKYLVVNKHFDETFAAGETLIGKTDCESGTRENADLHRSTDKRILEERIPLEMEETIWREGEKRTMLQVKFPLFDKNGKIFAISGIAADITERAGYHQQVLNANEKLSKSDKRKDEILSVISREIRSPMKGITRMADMLSGVALGDDQQNIVRKVRQSYGKLLQLSNDIDALSKIKKGEIKVAPTIFNVADIMEKVVAPFRTSMEEEDIELITGIHPDVPERIVGDPELLTHILSILFVNSIRFTRKGYIQLGVFPSKNGLLQFVVKDNGAGTNENQVNDLFEDMPSPQTVHMLEGSELGLQLARQLVELQDGTIEITSSEGLGTTCRFFLPYKHAGKMAPLAG